MLATNKISDIETKTADVLSTVEIKGEDTSFPVPLSKIAKNYGIEIKVVDFGDDNISGAFERSSNMIFVSSKESKTRQAFTIAHELGHAIMHKDKKAEILYRKDIHDFNGQLPQEEQEANWFAASLLMPANHVKRYHSILDDTDLLASIFGVSSAAMRYRLKNLNLL